jgi:hypothetical protein
MTEESQPPAGRPPAGQPPAGGVVISGGTVRIGALAQGSHARASSREIIQLPAAELSAEDREELQGLIGQLLAILRQHDGELADPSAIQLAVDEMSGELDQERPDRSRVRRLLDKIAAAAGSIADIATAVAAVQRAISGMV